jgi:hypothetical protein
MPKLNYKRIVLGGLLAGLALNVTETFFNVVLFGKEMEATFKAMNLPPLGGGAMAFFTLWGFAQGLISVWLYALLRDRLGAGPRTALLVGLVVWVFAWAYPNLSFGFMGMSPWRLVGIGLLWSLVETPAVTLLGAWLYREG